jgi:predicted nucleic-acid-binding protein
MIALDTNVLVRFLTLDDPEQGAAAQRMLSGLTAADPGFVCREVVIEIVWVLERSYGHARGAIAAAIERLLTADALVIEAADRVALAASRYAKGGPGFSDQMILLSALAERAELVTFDRTLAREAGARVVG